MEGNREQLHEQIRPIPRKSGVYQFSDENGKVIYVGKAKDLKARVSSYFTKIRHESAKTKLLVRKVSRIRYFVVGSEYEALLLENNMIKRYQPRYNIQLKDDKTYPFICVKKERFPRVFPTRNVIRDGSEYFGPYASVKMMNTLLDLIRQLYALRNCNYLLSQENIDAGKFKVCLEYHVKNCLGPCEGLQDESSYNESIRDVKDILRGHSGEVIDHLKNKMMNYSRELEYEKAETIRTKLNILKNFKGKSTVVSPRINNLDVFSFLRDEESAYVNYIKVVKGAIIQGHSIELKRKLDETDRDILLMAIAEMRQRFTSNSKEIVIPFRIELKIPDVRWTIPNRGDKKRLLDLSTSNARFFMIDKLKRMEHVDPDNYRKKMLDRVKSDLRLPEMPEQIECFDNSNIQGSNAVAACVVFRNGKPDKREYRHFNIRSVEGPDDYASMREIVFRRYDRIIREGGKLPQLIIIDGGKGQLKAAVESLEKLGLRGKISAIGIAKKLEEIYFPDDGIPLYLDKRSETLKLIQQLRNEAHRFGIQHHRKRRSKTAIKSGLSDLKGIGSETEKRLLQKFKSLSRIKQCSLEELSTEIGSSRAKIVYDSFR